MGKVNSRIPPVKLFCGVLYRDESDLEKALTMLVRKCGPIEDRSGSVPFVQTDYYEPEMGKDLKRMFVSFHRLIPRERIVGIKLYSNKVEDRFLSGSGGRRINLDPGFVSVPNVALATTKDFQHRVWLGRGIYLENTLRFRGGRWTEWEWTYPDYKTAFSLAWFAEIHKRYKKELREKKRPGKSGESD